MVPMSLFSRNDDLPGIHGTLRDCTPGGKGLRRFTEGDIAVVDAPDISRHVAHTLLELKPAVVLNISAFTTGSMPNYGPQMLLDAGITLVEELGAGFREGMKDGRKVRVTDEGQVFAGESSLGEGTLVTVEAAESNFASGQQALIDHMEAFFGNTVEFIHSEAPLLIDGLGVPDTGASIEGNKVLVVSPSTDHRQQIERLRSFIREYEPFIIGVEDAADTLVEMGYKPDLIICNPLNVAAETLRGGAKVVLPADPDGHAAGLERIQDLGVGAMTFPTATRSSTDLALLLAEYHGAELVVNAGAQLDLAAIFANLPEATPEALLTRMKVGARLVDAQAISDLYHLQSRHGVAWLWAILGVLVALAVIVVIAGTAGGGTFAENLVDTWNSIALTVQGWFH